MTLGGFVVAFILGWLVASSRRSAIDHALEEGTKGLPPRPAPPPSPRPTFIEDPTLGPDQVMMINTRNRSGASSSGWPT